MREDLSLNQYGYFYINALIESKEQLKGDCKQSQYLNCARQETVGVWASIFDKSLFILVDVQKLTMWLTRDFSIDLIYKHLSPQRLVAPTWISVILTFDNVMVLKSFETISKLSGIVWVAYSIVLHDDQWNWHLLNVWYVIFFGLIVVRVGPVLDKSLESLCLVTLVPMVPISWRDSAW